ncbi:MAG: flagellar hook protein FlgE [Candidatus Hydrogenedentota bacterium]
MGSALFTGVTALLANQRRLDAISSNISNVNTTGYKGSTVQFQDLFSQTLSGARAPVEGFGGNNPSQVGLGVQVGSIDVNHGQGSMSSTGKESDLAIEGAGMFVLSDGNIERYTRDGSFKLNADGQLIHGGTGLFVQGFLADEDGEIQDTDSIQNLEIPVGAQSIVSATDEARLVGNLDSDASVGTTATRTIDVFDSLGAKRAVDLTFEKTSPQDHNGVDYNSWAWQANFTNEEGDTNDVGSGTLLFDDNGDKAFEGTVDGGGVFTPRPEDDAHISISSGDLGSLESFPVDPFEFKLDFDRLTELSSSSDVNLEKQDGFGRGTLESFTIGRDGVINGVFTNGLTRTIGQVALSSFSNVAGLERMGENMFRDTPASGSPQVGLPNTGGRGQVSGGVLEGSNVDLSREFSDLITTQRAFQANARTISTSDEILQETVNLGRR